MNYSIPSYGPLPNPPSSGWVPQQLPGAPGSPAYNPVWNPSMAMAPGVASDMAQIPDLSDQAGYKAFTSEAMGAGDLPWLSKAYQQQHELGNQARERGGAEVAGQTAGAESALASGGGLSSGARERAAEGGAKNFMSMSQGTARDEANNAMQIGITGAQQKQQMLGQVPGMEQADLSMKMGKEQAVNSARQTDLQGAETASAGANQWNQGLYTSQMQATAAQAQADAIKNSGKHTFLGIGG